ncbi:MAG TPA: SPOR domain-containing protein [Gemmatimonadales bacterium]|nr:SPOR domain-containing protein [Gemmatimonadales bacterium]
MRRLYLCLGILTLVLAGTTTLARTAAAQSDPRLTAAVRAAQEGQGDSARSAVERLLAATPPTDSLYPEILYTQAMVANTAADMRRHLQRVAVEYPTSPWADDALLRLVQMDYATRSYEGAARNLERLRLDHPLTPLLAQAAYWGGRTYFELKDTVRACRWLADGVAASGTDLELQRQLGFLYQRCAAAGRQTVAAGDTAAAGQGRGATGDAGRRPGASADTGAGRRASSGAAAPRAGSPTDSAADSAAARVADSLPARPATPAPRFRVQVAAVATPGAADDAASKAEELGYAAVIVRERGLYKVRAGAFATRQEAQAAVAKLKSGLGGSPFVVAEP